MYTALIPCWKTLRASIPRETMLISINYKQRYSLQIPNCYSHLQFQRLTYEEVKRITIMSTLRKKMTWQIQLSH